MRFPRRFSCVLVSFFLAIPCLLPAKEPPQTHSIDPSWKAKLFGMRGFPAIPPGMTEAKFFPLVDEFGQYRHADWPGKIHNAAELAAARTAEADDLTRHPGPVGWDMYGGWAAGPQLAATGRFRTEKHDGRWWLVDPLGRLFWSHGIDCVETYWSTTPITDRERWFSGLPPKDSPLGKFYGEANWAPHNYYEGRRYENFSFSAANLQRKYGPDAWRTFHDLIHRRLQSWGMNTLGNWSQESICRMRKTPYVVTLHSGGRRLQGSEGYWGQFADVFDPSFAESIRADLARHQAEANDPWCLGCFVDNELGWGSDVSLAEAALMSPADQPAKRAFVAQLREKYGPIAQLNTAWGTKYASWNALLESRKKPDAKRAHDDLAAFAFTTAKTYFHICRDEVKRSAPQTLYLGCRFAWVNDPAVRAAGEYCDVISFNRYQKDVASLNLPAKTVDRPMMIGEFHFGALDRGMFHTGLVATASQHERAEAYRTYVRSAIRHPNIVGTHWFEFGDEALTGRGDGENYQIGFVDVCDTPYAETIAASRDIGAEMYVLRQQK